jgi:hypothetical protein
MSTRRMPRAQARNQEEEFVEENIQEEDVHDEEKEPKVRENVVMTAFKVVSIGGGFFAIGGVLLGDGVDQKI